VVLIVTSCFRLQEVTTPALSAPPLPSTGSGQALNQEGSFYPSSNCPLTRRICFELIRRESNNECIPSTREEKRR
jgi:hypothetical protein